MAQQKGMKRAEKVAKRARRVLKDKRAANMNKLARAGVAHVHGPNCNHAEQEAAAQ